MSLISAFQKNEDLLHNIRSHPDGSVKLWWLGQSGYLIRYNNVHVLVDPYLSDSLTRKYENTNKPHVRLSELAIDPSCLDFIDIVSSSHNHTDHLDGETLIPLIRSNPDLEMIIPEANREFVTNRIGSPPTFPIGLNDGQSVTVKGVTFRGVPAAHNEIDRNEQGQCRYMGYIIEIGEKKIYHSGDTLLFEGMSELLKPFKLDLAILPINGNDPSRGVAGNLSIDEAIKLGKDIEAKMVIPCHYDMFAFNTADPKEFAAKAAAAQLSYRVLRVGEGMELN
ncbi:MAG TPA: MBL fold metallo-hydrolase [Chitinophagaceae bacterium]|nr:MBL fold metallo-hydrolase [Chitinophagaceae bacterium]